MRDPINRLIGIILHLARLADEKHKTPFESDIGLGSRAFSGLIRTGTVELINMQDELASTKADAEYYRESLIDWETFSEEVFGRKDAVDFFTDDEKARMKEALKSIVEYPEEEA
jgi:hypothetical protein